MTHPPPPRVILHHTMPDDLGGRGGGARSREGFSLPLRPWDLASRGWTCVGVIRTGEDAAAAIEALARGVSLTIAVDVDADIRHHLLEDLHRLGRVVVPSADEPLGPPALRAEQAALLEALADGATIDEAADRLHVSRRTANRRLAELRMLLGVASTTEVLAHWGKRTGAP